MQMLTAQCNVIGGALVCQFEITQQHWPLVNEWKRPLLLLLLLTDSSNSSKLSQSQRQQPNNLNYFWSVSVFSFHSLSAPLFDGQCCVWKLSEVSSTNTLQVLNSNSSSSRSSNCNWRQFLLELSDLSLSLSICKSSIGAPNSLNLQSSFFSEHFFFDCS